MSVRLWLMVADCWQCGTSIELTEEQEREARRLLKERDQRSAAPQATAKADDAPRPPSGGKTARPPADAPAAESSGNGRQSSPEQRPGDRPSAEHAPHPVARPRDEPPRETSPDPTARPAPQPPARFRQPDESRHRPSPPPRRAAPDPVRRRMQQMARRRGVHAWAHELFTMTPAWLVSLVFHLVVLTILGMLSFRDDDGPYITLSSTVDRQLHREGGQQINVLPEDLVDFDLPIPDEVDLEQQEQREAILRADQEARELRLDPDAEDPNLPRLEQVKQQIKTAGRTRQSLAARDPRLRVEMVEREGGTTLTEAAVARGLRWLAMQQHADGSWNTSSTGGAVNNRAAGTSLALLPFLGAGQSHLVGRYRDHVSRGLRWLVQNQRPDGDLRGAPDNSGMYAHGQATIVLCEAYLMSGDEELRVPAQKAVDYIIAAQHPAGGWRYRPGMPGDTSVFGWQLMALQSARVANLTVPEDSFKLAGHYLDSAASHDGARYGYMPGNRPTHVMTAEALLCRMYMGWNRQDPALMQGMQYLVDQHPPSRDEPDYYYWYYGTQAFHHLGDSHWERWNLRMRDILVNLQESRGREAGSWPVRGPHASSGGRLYVTSLAVCTLEVYYRHLPIFRQLDLETR